MRFAQIALPVQSLTPRSNVWRGRGLRTARDGDDVGASEAQKTTDVGESPIECCSMQKRYQSRSHQFLTKTFISKLTMMLNCTLRVLFV